MNTTEFQALMNENLAQPDTALVFRAIVPPGNIESELDSYQARLFSLTGDPTLRFLSPFVPLQHVVAPRDPEQGAHPVRLDMRGAVSYLAPSAERHRHPLGVLYLSAMLRSSEGQETETALVIGISTLSSQRLEPEIRRLAGEDAWSKSGRGDSGTWGFSVSRTIQLTLTWLWENNAQERNLSEEPLGLQQDRGRI